MITYIFQDKKLLEIEFPEGFKKPRRFANHLANGIGVVIRHSPGLDFLTPWSEIENERILPVYAGLDVSKFVYDIFFQFGWNN